ncbi:MAG: hypothetical protein WAO59_08170 [Bacteroidales bacterium]
MRKIIYALILAVMMTSCMTYQGFYIVGLQNVERPENAKERYGESKIVNFEEEGKTKYSYEDDMIKIVWLPLSTQFSFTLQNKTDHSIKIIWDEAAYVDPNGSSGRVMHAGVKYIDRNNPQPPTVIVKNAIIDDMIVPTDNIYYVSGQYGGWRIKPMLPNRANTQEELNALTQQYIGKEVRVLLPLEIQGTVNEYIFTFKVEDFIAK